jgi:hypothetical protein
MQLNFIFISITLIILNFIKVKLLWSSYGLVIFHFISILSKIIVYILG